MSVVHKISVVAAEHLEQEIREVEVVVFEQLDLHNLAHLLLVLVPVPVLTKVEVVIVIRRPASELLVVAFVPGVVYLLLHSCELIAAQTDSALGNP